MSMIPAYTADEARARETFLALMWAFSTPAQVQTLPHGDAFAHIAYTLLDLETSYYTSDAALASHLKTSGARALPAESAAYHFYPTLDDAVLDTIRQASAGSMLFPDSSATLIIGAPLHGGTVRHVRGAGIPGTLTLSIQAPDALWQMRARHPYPMGWDIYFVAERNLIGIPRSTIIEQAPQGSET